MERVKPHLCTWGALETVEGVDTPPPKGSSKPMHLNADPPQSSMVCFGFQNSRQEVERGFCGESEQWERRALKILYQKMPLNSPGSHLKVRLVDDK